MATLIESPACKQFVLLGMDTKGQSQILAKSPELGYEDQRELLVSLTAANGLMDGVQYSTAALMGGGRWLKRRTFKPQEPVSKKSKKKTRS